MTANPNIPDFATNISNRLNALGVPGTGEGAIPNRKENGCIDFPLETNATTGQLVGGRLVYDSTGHMYFCNGSAWIQLAEVTP